MQSTQTPCKHLEVGAAAMQTACSKQVAWMSGAIEQHQQHYADRGEKMLTVQSQVVCVSGVAGGELILTRHLSLLGQYSSDYGAGGGLRLRFYTPGF